MLERNEKHLSRKEMLESVPLLNASVHWTELDTGCLMITYPKSYGPVRKFLCKILHVPETGQYVLDEPGSEVVRQIDGARTVRELIEYVSREFKLSRKESEVSLFQYLEALGQRRLVGFQVHSQQA
jgi:hypothetical protein